MNALDKLRAAVAALDADSGVGVAPLDPHDRRLLARLPRDVAGMTATGPDGLPRARRLGLATLAFDMLHPGADATGRLVALLSAAPAYHAALAAGSAPCILCGASADPSDPKVTMSLLGAYAEPAAAATAKEIDDARELACPRCSTVDGDAALQAAHTARLLETVPGASMIDTTLNPAPSPSRAERRRAAKVARKSAARTTAKAKAKVMMTKSESEAMQTLRAASEVPMHRLYHPAFTADWHGVIDPASWQNLIARDCVVCHRPTDGPAAIGLHRVDFLGRPLRDAGGDLRTPTFRVCSTCEALPPTDLVNAMLDHPDLRHLDLQAVGI